MVMMVAATAAFASGAPENDGWGRGGSWNTEPTEVSLTGTYVEDESGVYLETAEGTYSLSAPGYRRQEIDLESGDTIAVEGFLVEPCEQCVRDAEAHVMVQRATIDGEVYEIDRGPWMSQAGRGPWQMGRSGRRMSGPWGGRSGGRPFDQQDQFGRQGRRF
jgi:hypothetical protein